MPVVFIAAIAGSMFLGWIVCMVEALEATRLRNRVLTFGFGVVLFAAMLYTADYLPRPAAR